jgi:MscS family membrane protein
MKLRFESVFRGCMAVLVVLLIWSVWASAQEGAASDPGVAGADAVRDEGMMPGKWTPWLTFGLDRMDWLQVRILSIPLYQYFASLIYVFLALYLSKLIDILVRGRLRRWLERSPSKLNTLLVGLIRGPIRVVVFVVLLHLGLMVFEWPDWLQVVLSRGLLIAVAISLTYLALKVVDLLMGYWKAQATEDADPTIYRQLFPILRKSIQFFIVIVAVLVTSQNLGVNITGLIASLSIGGLALGLAAQDTLSNLFGALAVLLDKPFRIGDRIQLDGVDGVVESIGFRSTRVRNLDGHLVTVPNRTIGNATITNISLRPNIRTLINIGITYSTPAEKVKQALTIVEEVYRSHPMTQDAWISFNKFGDFSLNIFVVHWWKSTVYKDYLAGMQEMNLQLKQRFDDVAIDFAFPTQTLHLKQDSEWRLTQDPANQN